MSLPPFIQNIADQVRRGVFVAPTVFRTGENPRSYNYYNTLAQATARYREVINGQPQTVRPDGSYTMNEGGKQTLCINVDFWLPFAGRWYPVQYAAMRENYRQINWYVARGYLPTGAGPFFFVVNAQNFGIAATVIQSTPAQAAEMDKFYRELQLLKYTYNSLAAFLNELSKRQLSPQEQQIFNQGVLMLQGMGNEMRGIDGTDYFYNESGRVGLAPLLLLAVIAITTGAAAWTITKIATERNKTRRIIESYNATRWLTNKKTEVAAMAQAGTISQADKERIFNNLDNSLAAANAVAKETAKEERGIFDNLATIAQWGAIGLLGYTIIKETSRK